MSQSGASESLPESLEASDNSTLAQEVAAESPPVESPQKVTQESTFKDQQHPSSKTSA